MFRARDAVWSVLCCAALFVLFQLRPAWTARRFVERDSRAGFEQAFSGFRFDDGKMIRGEGCRTTPVFGVPSVQSRALTIEAERINWLGNKAEFVVRHRVEFTRGEPVEQDIHVALRKSGERWLYTLFTLRGAAELELPDGNPWAHALQAAGAGNGDPLPDG